MMVEGKSRGLDCTGIVRANGMPCGMPESAARSADVADGTTPAWGAPNACHRRVSGCRFEFAIETNALETVHRPR
jgi:hypothetical protein